MQLTDPALPWLLAILAAAVFVCLVLGLPRWHHRLARGVSRAVAALLMNSLVIMVGFLVLNNSYVFYSSWSDLFGTGPKDSSSQHGGTGTAALRTVHGTDLKWVKGNRDFALPDPGRSLQDYHVRDVASDATMQVLVQLPRGYDPASTRRYPVIIGLHGFPSVPASFTKINFLRTAESLTKQHQFARTIFVIPQINSPRQLDTECVNGPAPGDPQTDTWLSKELPPWIVRHLHVRTERQDWATLGYSFGGWCAAELTMRHPSLFSAAIVFEGYFHPLFGRDYVPLTGAQLKPYDLVAMAGHQPPPVAIWLFASQQDHLAYPTTHQFIEQAKAPLAVHAVIVPTGGHRTTIFEPYTAGSLLWLAKTLPAFRG
ncbi:hypothetical protein FOE78_07265 [Microlunatus elymi]|uniref:Esterase n=1 Tax=Microlunatus elymi TaxID=2596828 RepID=A0A516PX24_9ACTN|nr:alpha/beta hydrolase-fold protein [Microlunatus elymi]QDP95728.1 hypothetical protein FOE78_07265 [Microlunatus elymi]